MEGMYTAKEVMTWVLGALLMLVLFVVKKFEHDQKKGLRDLEVATGNRIKDHDEHLKLIDEALHQIQLNAVEQRVATADMRDIETRLMRVEHVLTRIDERLGGGKRRATDPDPRDL